MLMEMSTDTPEVEKTLVNFRVDTRQKARWERELRQSNQYSTLTQLIRSSVESELAGSHEATTQESPAISNDVDSIKGDVQRIKRDVRWLRNQEQDSVNISDTAQELFDTLEPLPLRRASPPDDQAVTEEQAAASLVIEGDEDEERHPQTIPALADRLGITKDECEDAIEHCREQFLPIVEVELNGRTHYFTEEQ